MPLMRPRHRTATNRMEGRTVRALMQSLDVIADQAVEVVTELRTANLLAYLTICQARGAGGAPEVLELDRQIRQSLGLK